MPEKKVALVTGANKGIGEQIAKDLAARDFVVLIGSRDLARGEDAAREVDGDARAIQLDVTDQDSIDAAAERIRDDLGRLDVLVNNAAVSHAGESGRPLEEIARSGMLDVVSLDEAREVFATNVFGVIAVTQAMLPLLREAPAARIVNIGSSAGSLTLSSEPDNPNRAMFGVYPASKAALNAVTVGLSASLEADGIKVNSVSPGFTSTELNEFAGTRTVEEAAEDPVHFALLDDDGPTGSFWEKGEPLPW